MRWQNPEKQEYGYYNINLLVSHLTQILPIRGKQRAPDEKAAYPCWASIVPIFVQVCLSTVFYGGYVFIIPFWENPRSGSLQGLVVNNKSLLKKAGLSRSVLLCLLRQN